MKKIALLFSVFSITAVQSQNWCPPGAMWHYKSWGSLVGVDAELEFNYEGDTVINGKTCKKIVGLFMGKDMYKFPNISYTVVPRFSTHYMYENNDVLYSARGNTFDTIVDFNAKPGDKWTIHSMTECPYQFTWVVYDTVRVSVNGVSLRTIKAWTNGMNFMDSVTNIFVERLYTFGMAKGFDVFNGGCYDGAAEFTTTYLSCYRDSTFGIYSVSDIECERVAGLADQVNNYYYVASDVAGGGLVIDVPARGHTATIYSVLGSKVFVSELEQGRNNIVTGLPEGVYVIRIADDVNERFAAKAFVSH